MPAQRNATPSSSCRHRARKTVSRPTFISHDRDAVTIGELSRIAISDPRLFSNILDDFDADSPIYELLSQFHNNVTTADDYESLADTHRGRARVAFDELEEYSLDNKIAERIDYARRHNRLRIFSGVCIDKPRVSGRVKTDNPRVSTFIYPAPNRPFTTGLLGFGTRQHPFFFGVPDAPGSVNNPILIDID